MQHIADLNPVFLSARWKRVKKRVVLTDERKEHILEGHREDFENYGQYMGVVIENPLYILTDPKNENTALYIGQAVNSDLTVVVKIAFEETEDKCSSVITMYRIGEKRLRRLLRNNEMLYRRE